MDCSSGYFPAESCELVPVIGISNPGAIKKHLPATLCYFISATHIAVGSSFFAVTAYNGILLTTITELTRRDYLVIVSGRTVIRNRKSHPETLSSFCVYNEGHTVHCRISDRDKWVAVVVVEVVLV
jgi:hypothetical protein